MAPANLDYMNLVTDLQQVLRSLYFTPEWVIVVCPNMEVASQCTRVLGAALPKDILFSGRTAQFKNHSRVSVVAAQEPQFVPEDMSYAVAFLGWKSTDDSRGMYQWQTRATRILRAEVL
jgi:hypothetical protein